MNHISSACLCSFVALTTLAVGCVPPAPSPTGTHGEDNSTWAGDDDDSAASVDGDLDGFNISDGDCNDGDPDVYPGAAELCNGVDDDCNGLVDDGLLRVYYADWDLDGHGDPQDSITACTAPDGYVDLGDDCDDSDPHVHPGSNDVCDGVDRDCDGLVMPVVEDDLFDGNDTVADALLVSWGVTAQSMCADEYGESTPAYFAIDPVLFGSSLVVEVEEGADIEANFFNAALEPTGTTNSAGAGFIRWDVGLHHNYMEITTGETPPSACECVRYWLVFEQSA